MFCFNFWTFFGVLIDYCAIIQPASRYKDTSDSTHRTCKATQHKSRSTRGRNSPRPQSSSRSVPRPKSQNHSAAAKKSPGDRNRFMSTAERVNTANICYWPLDLFLLKRLFQWPGIHVQCTYSISFFLVGLILRGVVWWHVIRIYVVNC